MAFLATVKAPAQTEHFIDRNIRHQQSNAPQPARDPPDYLKDYDQDEAIWQLDDVAESVRSRTQMHDETMVAAMAEETPPDAPTPEQEEAEEQKIKQREALGRDLLTMAGSVSDSTQRLPCPVVLSCASAWIDVVFVAAQIVGSISSSAAMVAGATVAIVAGAARELQKRTRANTFLEMVNRDLFMPRGLFAVVMAFKPEVPSSQQGPLVKVQKGAGNWVNDYMDRRAAAFHTLHETVDWSLTQLIYPRRRRRGRPESWMLSIDTLAGHLIPGHIKVLNPNIDLNSLKMVVTGNVRVVHKSSL
ncbi:uncharacterized protein ASPGLDRAFT_86028 [Aspergillus glaucus CBS 516.65]|uniref:Uncharacterized protein n=1 Tax=Aspergillus glaucus CBS 516.65 TaxID=1160497 RepID=A0A1L9V5F8_ASPGL|nr:hypothetical protein ASPGLDRAFT_86028 [Aspergillus glaucus CBS 516.65]OJJ79160.1 hypothetical protein ASPGLDRAFT_86028 [Aspergillus glaucus CBS 516.65]